MKNQQDYYHDIKEIRTIMERTTRFISLSGLSGVLAGIYALAGSFLVYRMMYGHHFAGFRNPVNTADAVLIRNITLIAVVVLLASLSTGMWLSYNKSKRDKTLFWGPGSRQFLMAISVPLLSGGLFIGIMTLQGCSLLLFSFSTGSP